MRGKKVSCFFLLFLFLNLNRREQDILFFPASGKEGERGRVRCGICERCDEKNSINSQYFANNYCVVPLFCL